MGKREIIIIITVIIIIDMKMFVKDCNNTIMENMARLVTYAKLISEFKSNIFFSEKGA